MRQFFYGLVLGLATLYVWETYDIPGVWNYLTGQKDWAASQAAGFADGKQPRR